MQSVVCRTMSNETRSISHKVRRRRDRGSVPIMLTFSSTALLLSLLSTAVADDISVGGISRCNGGGEYKVSSAACDNCNWGEEATLSGSVNKDSCSDICIVGTAHAAMGIGESFEVFKEDNYDCSDFSQGFKIPGDLPAALENIASGHVTVEFFDGGCDGQLVGCSKIALSGVSPSVKVAGAAVGVAAVAGAGALIYKNMGAGAGATAAVAGGGAPSTGFVQMGDSNVV